MRRPSIDGRPRRHVRDDGRSPAVRRGPAGRLHRCASATSTSWSRRRRWASSSSGSRDNYHKSAVAASLDAIKNLCYRYASQAGLTVSIDDVKTPKAKKALLDDYEAQADKVENQFRRGIITDGERRQQEVRIWTDATAEVQEAMEAEFKAQRFNPIDMMVGSGARGNMTQMRQIAGMRGLVANPRGDMIPRPIKKNFREGLETLEYFIATPGARKGLVDTALRTADSGYLTRRLVDVAQELIVRERRLRHAPSVCGSRTSRPTRPTSGRTSRPSCSAGRLLARRHADRWHGATPRNTIVGDIEMAALRDDPNVNRVRIRSVLTCDAELGVCALCYGRSLATGKSIELGEAVGVIAAQSIGEPGTQLTMRTFHTGGVAGKDIAGGLPRVVELFEARTPRGSARLARASGVVRIGDDEGKGIPVTVDRRSGRRAPGRAADRQPRRSSPTARTSRPASRSPTVPSTRRRSWRSRASARPRRTSSKRSRRCTATRVCRSATSTSS